MRAAVRGGLPLALMMMMALMMMLLPPSNAQSYYDDAEDQYVPTDEKGDIRPKQSPRPAQPPPSTQEGGESEAQPEQESAESDESADAGSSSESKPDAFEEEEDEENGEQEAPRSRPAQPSAPADDPEIELPKISYYELLKVDFTPEPEALKKAYRAAALANHPDKFRDPLEKRRASKLFVRIVTAYEVLSKPMTRRRYNDLLRAGIFDYDYAAWIKLMGEKDMIYDSRGSAEDVLFRNFEDANRAWFESGEQDFDEQTVGLSLALGAVSVLGFLFLPGYIIYEKQTRKKREREALARRVKEKRAAPPVAPVSSPPARSPSTLAQKKEASAATNSNHDRTTPESSYVSSFSTASSSKSEKKDEKSFEHIPWSLDEMSLLAKAMQKYPGGTRDRWTAIATFFHNSTRAGILRSQKEITAKAKELHPDHAAARLANGAPPSGVQP